MPKITCTVKITYETTLKSIYIFINKGLLLQILNKSHLFRTINDFSKTLVEVLTVLQIAFRSSSPNRCNLVLLKEVVLRSSCLMWASGNSSSDKRRKQIKPADGSKEGSIIKRP